MLTNIFFELTKEAKMARIGALERTIFIDDLPEFLDEAAFPKGVERLLFDPKGENAHIGHYTRTGILVRHDEAAGSLPPASGR